MGIRRKAQLKVKQRNKRKRRRDRLSKEGKNPDEHFSDGFYVGRTKR